MDPLGEDRKARVPTAAPPRLSCLPRPTGKPFGIPCRRINPGPNPDSFLALRTVKIYDMGQYVVMHMEKRMEISPVLERHITRIDVKYLNGVRTETVYTPDNADPERAALNKELISRERINAETGEKKTLTINQAIRERIDEARIKVRKNQNTALEMIFTGSHDTMTSLSPTQLDAWCQETLDWCAEQWGRKNMVSAVLHCDEETPHIHLIVVPIVEGQSRRSASREKKLDQEGKVVKKYNIDKNKARLSANEVYTQPRLYQYWDSYAEKVGAHFGLDRGIRAEPGSKKHHQPSIDFNRQLDRYIEEKNALIASITADYAEKEKEVERIQSKMDEMSEGIEKNSEILKGQESTIESGREKIEEQEKQIAKNKDTIQAQDKKISSLAQIGQDATEKEIAAQIKTLSTLRAEKTKLEQEIAHVKAKLEAEKATLNQVTKQIHTKVNLDKVPKKGAFEYKADDVESFVKSVSLATLKQAMNQQYPQISEVDSQYYKEVQRLQGVEREYNELLYSPEKLRTQLSVLQDQANRKSVVATLEYVLDRKVTIHDCTVKDTPRGKDIFATFSFPGKTQLYAVRIDPDEKFAYTPDTRVTSLEKAQALFGEKIWHGVTTLPAIRQQRTEDSMAAVRKITGGTQRSSPHLDSKKLWLRFGDRQLNISPDGNYKVLVNTGRGGKVESKGTIPRMSGPNALRSLFSALKAVSGSQNVGVNDEKDSKSEDEIIEQVRIYGGISR